MRLHKEAARSMTLTECAFAGSYFHWSPQIRQASSCEEPKAVKNLRREQRGVDGTEGRTPRRHLRLTTRGWGGMSMRVTTGGFPVKSLPHDRLRTPPGTVVPRSS